MDRIYEPVVLQCLEKYPQMIFLVGPRQVGKTTLAKKIQSHFQESLYLNWDVLEDRQKILSGQTFIKDFFPLHILRKQKPLIIFDEIHKHKNWKNYLKGFYDLYKDHYHIIVTGSARLDIYQSGGDSLMGRYFQYCIHPLSLPEILFHQSRQQEHQYFYKPFQINEEDFRNLYKFGGFPDPFLLKKDEYFNLWQTTRLKQLIFEDIQTLSSLHEVSLLEVLAEILKSQSGQLLNRNSLAKKIQVTNQTISRWLETLERFYYCFSIKPWFENVTRSLIKEPKVYLWDWSLVAEEGARFENFVASHLLKFTHFWAEQGYGKFELYYLRDIDKKEVDFLITKDRKPFLMVEAKASEQKMSPAIGHFQAQLHPEWSFQVVKNMEYVEKSCFDLKGIWTIPAKTFLSQLI